MKKASSHIKWQTAQFFEIRWWEKYLQPKNKAEYLKWKTQYWQSVWEKCIPFIAENHKQPDQEIFKIWDAGCGPAGIFLLFEKAQVYASDPLLKQYHKKELLLDQGKANIVFETKSLEEASPNKEFDFIFCMNALNHVADILMSIQNLKKHLKKGGHLILTLDCHKSIFLKKLFQLIPGDILHPHQYTLQEYIDLFTDKQLHFCGQSLIKPGKVFDHHLLIFRKT